MIVRSEAPHEIMRRHVVDADIPPITYNERVSARDKLARPPLTPVGFPSPRKLRMIFAWLTHSTL